VIAGPAMARAELAPDLIRILNLLGGAPGFVVRIDDRTGKFTVSNPGRVPAGDGTYLVAGQSRLKGGRVIDSVFHVNTDTGGTLLGAWWKIDGHWTDHQDPEAPQALGLTRAEVFPFDWTYAVAMSDDIYH